MHFTGTKIFALDYAIFEAQKMLMLLVAECDIGIQMSIHPSDLLSVTMYVRQQVSLRCFSAVVIAVSSHSEGNEILG